MTLRIRSGLQFKACLAIRRRFRLETFRGFIDCETEWQIENNLCSSIGLKNRFPGWNLVGGYRFVEGGSAFRRPTDSFRSLQALWLLGPQVQLVC